jgi:hypothetical protein
MATAATEIERLVREVLAELAAAGPVRAGEVITVSPPKGTVPFSSHENRDSPPLARTPSPGAVAGSDSDGELTVAARVVTMNELIGRLQGLRRVVVLPEAIVTPAVRDELQRRNVALVRARTPCRAGGGTLRLVLVASGKGFDLRILSDALGKEGVAVESQTIECLIAATDLLAAEVVQADTLGVLATPHWAAALCLANRRPGVRAVLGPDVPAAAAASAAVGANLLVIDPEGGTMFQWKQMLAEYCRNGVRGCPAVFQKRLG